MKSILASALMGVAALWLPLLWDASHAREQYPGQYKDVPKDVQEWFRNQRNPKNGAHCCTEADGVYAEEDIRNDRFGCASTGRRFAWQGLQAIRRAGSVAPGAPQRRAPTGRRESD
jgi:hypothetical protein